MTKTCPQCGTPVPITKPGFVQCTNCMTTIAVPAEDFLGPSGTHIDDQTVLPRPNVTEFSAPASSQDEQGQPGAPGKPLCEICRHNPVARACASCGKLICNACARANESGLPVCSDCAAPKTSSDIAFEDVTADTFFQKFIATIQHVALRPSDFFSRLPVPGKFWPAVLFGVVVDLPGAILQLAANLLLQPQIMKYMSQIFDLPAQTQSSFGMGMGILSFVFGLIFVPVGSFIGIFISGAITHVILLLLGGIRGGFEDTVRATGYANVTSLAKLVPGAGSLIAYVWSLVVLSIGLSKVHGIPTWKAVTALLIPAFICCCGLVFVGIFAFSGIMALLAH